MAYNITEPTEALDFWLDTVTTICDQHAPYKQKKVRSVPKLKWFTEVLQEAIYLRDFLKKHGQLEKSNNQGKAINSIKRAAKKKYTQGLPSDKKKKTKTKKPQLEINMVSSSSTYKQTMHPFQSNK